MTGKLKYTIGAIIIVSILSISISGQAALLGWDLVDSGKHLDWSADTSYIESVNSGVYIWEDYKSGVIREDSVFTTEDVYISDYYEVSNTMGKTSSQGTIKLNDYHYSSMTMGERVKTTTHEFGHALGLDHTDGDKDIMRQGKFSLTTLSSTDKSSYDKAYDNY